MPSTRHDDSAPDLMERIAQRELEQLTRKAVKKAQASKTEKWMLGFTSICRRIDEAIVKWTGEKGRTGWQVPPALASESVILEGQIDRALLARLAEKEGWTVLPAWEARPDGSRQRVGVELIPPSYRPEAAVQNLPPRPWTNLVWWAAREEPAFRDRSTKALVEWLATAGFRSCCLLIAGSLAGADELRRAVYLELFLWRQKHVMRPQRSGA